MAEQLNIPELRERIDAAITTVCSGMAAMSIPANPRDVDLVLADCLKLLDAAEECDALKAKLAALVKAVGVNHIVMHHSADCSLRQMMSEVPCRCEVGAFKAALAAAKTAP